MSWTAAVALVVFAVVSAIIGAALAGAGGWRAMAARFPAPALPPAGERRYRFSTIRTAGGMLGTASYGSCVTVGLSDQGISLALWAPFRLFHPPMLIPWTAVETCRTIAVYGGHTTHVSVREAGSFTSVGRTAEAIARAAGECGIPVRPL